MLVKTNGRLQEIALSISRDEAARKDLADDIREQYATAKAEGYTVPALKKAIKIFAMDKDARDKHDSAQMDLETYLAALEGQELR